MFRKVFVALILVASLLSSIAAAERYAVLITGDVATKDDQPEGSDPNQEVKDIYDPTVSYNEFWHDTYLMWEMLMEMGYNKDNIIVLYGDGDDFWDTEPGAWVHGRYRPSNINVDGQITKYAATIGNVELAAQELQNRMTESDFLFVWTFGHGKVIDLQNKVSALILRDGEMTDSHFADYFNLIPAHKKVYWMQQCAGGGFYDNLQSENTFFSSAANMGDASRADDKTKYGIDISGRENEVRSDPVYGERIYTHGEYNFHMYSSTTGMSPAGNIDYYGSTVFFESADVGYKDKIITVEESVEWNKSNNSKHIGFSDDPGNMGYHTTLKYPTILFPSHEIGTDFYTGSNLGGLIGVYRSNTEIYINVGETIKINPYSHIFFEAGAALYIEDNILELGKGSKITGSADFSHIELTSFSHLILDDSYVENMCLYAKPDSKSSITLKGLNDMNNTSIYVGTGCDMIIGNNSNFVLNENFEFEMEEDSRLVLTDGSEFNVENFPEYSMKQNTEVRVTGEATIKGDFSISADCLIVIGMMSKLRIARGSNITLHELSTLKLEQGAQLIIEEGAVCDFSPGSEIKVGVGSEIIVGGELYSNGSYDFITNISLPEIDKGATWKGIRAENGSVVSIKHSNISDAEKALFGSTSSISVTNSTFINCTNGISVDTPALFEVTNSTFEGCTNGIDLLGMQSGSSYSITDNTLIGNDTGSGIAITSSDGIFSRNKISHFNTGARFTMSSPAVSKCEFTYNKYHGILVSGHDALPQLINTEQMQTFGELNCLIEKNAYGSGTSLFPSSQIGIIPVGNIYMRNNDIISSPNFPGISIAQAAFRDPTHILLDAQYNYWGTAQVSDDYFFGHSHYTIDYEPYYSAPCGTGSNPSLMQSVSTESKLLSNALNLEAKDNVTPAIKLYEHIIKKYVDTPEYYVAMTRLPYLYEKAGFDNNELIATYDEALESDGVSHKKFFKGKKVATHIKGKRYDEAIAVAEEMKAEAEIEEEIILADINIAIANMLKDSEGKGKNGTQTDDVRELISKLYSDEEKNEPSVTTETVLPSHNKLFQNYPNPFNPVTQIKFALTKTAEVKLSVYNIGGQKVAELANGSRQAGVHTVDFDGSRLNSGVYYYTLEVDGKNITRNMLLIK
jgi:hypothetical protein